MTPQVEPIDTSTEPMLSMEPEEDEPLELTPKGGTPVGKLFQCCLPMPSNDKVNFGSPTTGNQNDQRSRKIPSEDDDEDLCAGLPELEDTSRDEDSSSHDSEAVYPSGKKGSTALTAQQALLIGFFQILLGFLGKWGAPFQKQNAKYLTDKDKTTTVISASDDNGGNDKTNCANATTTSPASSLA